MEQHELSRILSISLPRSQSAFLVCNERSPRVHDGVEVLPWREFLARLWGGEILGG